MTSLTRRRIAFVIVLVVVAAASSLVRAGAPQAVGTWRSLGSTPDARVGAAAVSLSDGRVLITGGTVAGAETASVTLFSPADGSFASAGQLLRPRSGHTATLLKDGRVLIAGGVSQGVTTADLEIFDPATETSAVPGSLTQARTGHASALLADGRVFVTGGTGADGVLDTSDVFDPADNSVAATALHMLSPRTGASATTLIDGRVLIAGGNDGTQDLASAEIFDPVSATFEATTTSLSVPRSGHTAVLLPWNGSVLIAGGTSNGAPQAATDLFVPAQFPDPYSWGMGTFAATGALTQPRAGAVGAPHIEGYSVVIGGGAADAEVYRFATLKTDADDYAPGTKAIITGAGWQPDTDVSLVFQEDPAVHDDYVLTVHADTEGKIYWDQWAPEQHDLNVRFYLLAKQQLADGSERRAQITFTDGNATKVSGTVRSSAAGNPALSGVTITCTSGCNNSPAASTTTNAAGAYLFDNTTTKLSFAGNGPANLTLTASKTGFVSKAIIVTVPSNGANVTGQDFTLDPSIAETTLSAQPASGTYDGTVNLSATLTSGGNGVAGKSVAFTLNGTAVGSATTAASGVASLTGVNLGTITVGSYPNAIGASFAGDAAFSSSSATATLTVTRATQATVTVVAPAAATYGQTGLSATASGGSGTGAYVYNAGASSACSVDSATGGLTITSGTGTCAITATRTGDANYNDSAPSAAATVAISKASAVVTVNGYTGIYDGNAHGATGTAKGLNDVDLGAELHLGSTFTNVPGGTANWTFDGDTNYAPQSGQVQITINKKTASVTPNAAGKTYGDADPTLTGTLNGFLPADTVTATYNRAAGETVAGGPYTISATLSPAGVLGNYDITYNTANFTINRKTASVTPNTAGKTYGDADPALTGTLSGFLGADNVSATYARTAGETVGGSPYAISATLSPAGVLGNYDITYNTANFTINTKTASVTPNAAGKTYGDADPALTGTLSGFLAADTVTATYSRTAGETVAGGPYAISATLSPAGVLGNYDITYNTANFTINRKTASVTPNAASKTYGDADPTLTGTLSGFLDGDNVTATYSRTAGETVAGGPYTISVTLSPAGVLGNYDITYSTANFTINRKTASVTPNTASKTYGDADPTFTGTLSGFLDGDTVTATYSRTAGETVAGGPYTISATLNPVGVLGNYDITYNTANFTINRKTASVTPNAAGKTYGDADPTLTGTLSGFLAADNVTATYSRTAGETVAGGPYTISATLSPAGVLGNYDITYNAANFTINRKTASVTPNAASKTYGDADPTLTGTLSGFLAADTVTATYSRTAGETVAGGPYTISATLSPVGVLGNYDITCNTANFTINRKTASVTPNTAGKTYGDADPALTGTLSGFLAADTVTATYSRTAGETVAGGPYTISATLSPVGVLGNYDITYNTANFTIVKRVLTVTPDGGKTKLLGETFTAFTGTVTNLAVGDAGFPTYSSAGAPASAPVGSYDITSGFTLTAGSASNYEMHLNTAVKGLTIGYGVCALYDQTKAVKRNATVPVKFYLCTASGQDVSSSAIVVTATTLTPTSGSVWADVEDSGNANPDNNFRFDPTLGPSGGYIFNLSTKDVPAAMWRLTFTVSGASFGTYNLGFGVK